MRRRLLLSLILIFLLPLVGMGWLGLRLAGEEQVQLERRFEALLLDRLKESARLVEQRIAAREQRLFDLTGGLAQLTPQALRERRARFPEIDALFVQEPGGALRFPDARAPLSEQERSFLVRTRSLWEERTLLHPAQSERGAAQRSGWYAWHWGSGLHLLYWRVDAGGAVVGAELDPLALLSEVIGALPDGREPLPDARIQLVDARGQVLYGWGDYEPRAGETPRASLTLAPPLESWRLVHFTPRAAAGAGTRFLLLAALLGLALVLAGLAFYAFRELTRAVREAGQRVNFVNQVSHELKTPLTNIRLYAELLAEELEEEDESARKVGIIVAETRRLSRLIGNVLGFARAQRGQLRLNRLPRVLDECVREVVEQFRPGFGQAGIEVDLALAAPEPIAIDPDAVAQIVANLLSNVEKYAAGGGRVRLASSQDAKGVELRVCDCGPGIPASQQAQVFKPFYRIRNDLTEGVSGTGIGLAIARDLARLHGGDLRLAPSERGACFRLTLPAKS